MPPLGEFPFGIEKLEWWDYPMVKKIEDINGLHTIPACDGRADGQTGGHLATAYTCYAYASRGKNCSASGSASSSRPLFWGSFIHKPRAGVKCIRASNTLVKCV